MAPTTNCSRKKQLNLPLFQRKLKRMCSSIHQSRRVVVTGLGVVSCLGTGIHFVWDQLLSGTSGITNIKGEAFEQIPSKVVGLVRHGNNPGEFNLTGLPTIDGRAVTQMTQYCLRAAEEALTMAKWKPVQDNDKERTGVCIGTGMIPLEEVVNAGELQRQFHYRKISPWFIPRILINMAAAHVSLAYGFKGPNHSVSTACTTGLHSIGDAFRFIRNGDADVIVAGGCESSVTPLAMAGFARMRALSTNFNATPQVSSRPFDKARDGFVMSEGAALLVLEELDHARQRNAHIYAEILGYGLSSDAKHITAPPEDGRGAQRCMEAALRDSHLKPEQIEHINCHATSTPLGDSVESRAIQSLFKNHSSNILVNSTKGATGHLLGAAGSIEAAFTVMSVYTGTVPATLNLQTPMTGCDLNYVLGSNITWNSKFNPRIALTNSFGFGGTNASLCISEYVV
uniref:3-oxoacyl-[acyl-carrier-protein] synthase n=2 Tax=Biomphalaria glabrata TaxID=6526 RepID=A0A2C9JQ33_BIOGL